MLGKPLSFHFLVQLLDVGLEEPVLSVGCGFHTLQGPAVAVDGHRATKTIERTAAHGVKRNHIERIALPDRMGRFQGEEITRLAATADGVDVVGTNDVDGFIVETDALHAADHIHESGLFHACNLGAQHVLQLTVG